MRKPIILAVDDEPDVLRNIERDLRDRYEARYRVMRAGSGNEAIEVTRRLKQRDDPVALFVTDQRMPEMEGTSFLTQALTLYPEARSVLLTAYADTSAAIRSINEIGLDHYLMKPWDPPEEALYPVIDDLLESWAITARLPFEGVRVAGTLWSPTSHDVKDFLARNRIPYQWLDIERDNSAKALVDGVPGGAALPVVFLATGTALRNPDRKYSPKRLACGRERREASTISSSSAAGRVASPPPSMERRKGYRQRSSNRRRREDRPAPARA